MDRPQLAKHVSQVWDQEIVPAITEYIRIPNKSPSFDPEWAAHGHMQRAIDLIASWCRRQPIAGMAIEIVSEPGRTPLIFIEVPAFKTDRPDTVLLYGHLDKQPEMVGWAEGLGPWSPVMRGERLYGRGGADDGYSAFAALTSIAALQAQGAPHARSVVMIEASEESGSPDLPHYVDRLASRIGKCSLVVCLDSGCGDYDHLWCTTSLRGMVVGDLTVEILREGVHSGDASGLVASSFRIARQLLTRLEDERTGEIRLPELVVPIPEARAQQAAGVAKVLGSSLWDKFPFVEGARPISDDLVQLALGRTWRPTLSVTGAEGLPALKDAGSVLRPKTALKLSVRLPPTCDALKAYKAVKVALEREPPYGAKVTFEGDSAPGWNSPALSPWLEAALLKASKGHFGAETVYMGEGGSIPFMGMLGARFPEAQFVITGVLGPQSNAHGPNEFLDIPTGKKITACVSEVLTEHAIR